MPAPFVIDPDNSDISADDYEQMYRNYMVSRFDPGSSNYVFPPNSLANPSTEHPQYPAFLAYQRQQAKYDPIYQAKQASNLLDSIISMAKLLYTPKRGK